MIENSASAEELKRRRECLDKLTWNSREEAVAAAAYSEWQRGGSKPKPYQCRHCGKWHLASA